MLSPRSVARGIERTKDHSALISASASIAASPHRPARRRASDVIIWHASDQADRAKLFVRYRIVMPLIVVAAAPGCISPPDRGLDPRIFRPP